MRHWLWFVVAGVIVIASMAGAGLYAAPKVVALAHGMKRVPVPGSASIELSKAGPYTIYREEIGAQPSRSGISVRLTEEASGASIALAPPTASSSYSIRERKGVSILAFTIDHPGAYRVTATLTGGEGTTTLAIEQGTAWEMVRIIFAAAAIGMAGLVVAGVLVAIVIWQRSKVAAKVAPGGGPST